MNISVNYRDFIDALDKNSPKEGVETSFYYNRYSEKIESLESIISEFKTSADAFELENYDYLYIPIPTYNQIQWEREYIKSLNNKSIASIFAKTKDDNEFDSLFNAQIYNTWNGFVDWSNYEIKIKHAIIVQWCVDYKVLIRYAGKIMKPDDILKEIKRHSYPKF